jgi:hypothetical protein
MRAVMVRFHKAGWIISVRMKSIKMRTDMLHRSKFLPQVNTAQDHDTKLQHTCVTAAPAVRIWFFPEIGSPKLSLVTGISLLSEVIASMSSS